MCVTSHVHEALCSTYMPDARMSLMGVLTVPGKYMALTTMALSLVTGGPSELLQACTGVAAGYLWCYLKDPPRSTNGRRDARLLAFIARYVSPRLQAPDMLRRLVTDGSQSVRRTTYGTVFTQRRNIPSATSNKINPSSGRSHDRKDRSQPSREAILAATEARLRKSESN